MFGKKDNTVPFGYRLGTNIIHFLRGIVVPSVIRDIWYVRESSLRCMNDHPQDPRLQRFCDGTCRPVRQSSFSGKFVSGVYRVLSLFFVLKPTGTQKLMRWLTLKVQLTLDDSTFVAGFPK